jgi:hypothetical protein
MVSQLALGQLFAFRLQSTFAQHVEAASQLHSRHHAPHAELLGDHADLFPAPAAERYAASDRNLPNHEISIGEINEPELDGHCLELSSQCRCSDSYGNGLTRHDGGSYETNRGHGK